MYRKMLMILPVILLGFITSGCYRVNDEFLELKNEILYSTGSSYKRDVEFALGSVSMSIVRAFAGVDRHNEDMLKYISKMQIGIYKSTSTEPGNYNLFQRINDKLEHNGWKYFVRETDENGMNIIYFQNSREENLEAMFIVSLNNTGLTLVEMQGKLGKVVLAAIREKGIPIEPSKAHNSYN